jgi:peptidoglycan/LPS O-acetylase OafA/YrhL
VKRDAPHVPTLDGVRAVAAYGVILTHVGFNSGRSLDDGPAAPFLARLDFGVTLFFLLSGFLLFRPFALAIITRQPAPALAAFWWRRALRIFPAYWVVVCVSLSLLTERTPSGAQWRGYLLMTQTYESLERYPGLRHMWTLATEVSFYAALPLLALVPRLLAKRFDPVRALLGFLGLLVAGALAANLASHAIGGDDSPALQWLAPNLDWFALGMTLAVATCAPTGAVGVVDRLRLLAHRAPGTCWIVGGLLFWFSTLPLAGPRNLEPATEWQYTLKHYLYGASAFFLLVPVILGASELVRRTMGRPVMSFLGTISYGVYLWHLPLLIAIQRWLGWRTFSGHFWELLALTTGSSTALAALSWYLLEQPLLRRLSRPWAERDGRTKPAAEPTAVSGPPDPAPR